MFSGGEEGWRERLRVCSLLSIILLQLALHELMLLHTQWLGIMITSLSRVSFILSSSFRHLPKKEDEKS